MKLYFWCQLKRVVGKVGPLPSGKPWQPSSTADNSDAMGTGQFDDSITFVGFATAWGNQSQAVVASKWKNEQIRYGESIGFDHCVIVAITEKEYQHWTRQLSEVET